MSEKLITGDEFVTQFAGKFRRVKAGRPTHEDFAVIFGQFVWGLVRGGDEEMAAALTRAVFDSRDEYEAAKRAWQRWADGVKGEEVSEAQGCGHTLN